MKTVKKIRIGYSMDQCSFGDVVDAICGDFGLTRTQVGKLEVFYSNGMDAHMRSGTTATHFFKFTGIAVLEPGAQDWNPIEEVIYHSDGPYLTFYYNPCVCCAE